jgi:hypothetical protein
MYRMQQQQLHQELLGEASQARIASAKTATSLGPIAEGLEGSVDAVIHDQHAAPASPKPRRGSADNRRLSFTSELSAAQLTARHLPVGPADGWVQQQQQEGEQPPQQQQQSRTASAATARGSPEGGGRSRSPVLQQLALDDIDKELASLGLGQSGTEPGTPSLMFGSTTAAEGAAAADGMWAGMNADPKKYLNMHSGELAPAAATGPAASASVEPPLLAPSQPVEPKPAKDPARRVTLFTESMRERGECPAPPRSPRFEQRGLGSKGVKQTGLASASGAQLDELIDAHASLGAGPTAGGGA